MFFVCAPNASSSKYTHAHTRMNWKGKTQKLNQHPNYYFIQFHSPGRGELCMNWNGAIEREVSVYGYER